MATPIRIGTRGSALALFQARQVADALRAALPERGCEVETIRSAGDRSPDAPIASLGTGAFTGALQQALLDGRVDAAVHSLKDLPVGPTPGVATIPVLERADPRDALIDRLNRSLFNLPPGARVGTSSPRRTAQLRRGRSDLDYLPIRGNVDTRVRKVADGEYDAVVLAAAGLLRLGLTERVTEFFSPRAVAPAPGQGALAVQVRSDDEELLAAAGLLRHEPTAAAVEAERWVLRAAGAGCLIPIGAYGEVGADGALSLFAAVTSLDGAEAYRAEVNGPVEDPCVTGRAAYAALLEEGAGALLGVEGAQ